jgi:hypothetical protein
MSLLYIYPVMIVLHLSEFSIFGLRMFECCPMHSSLEGCLVLDVVRTMRVGGSGGCAAFWSMSVSFGKRLHHPPFFPVNSLMLWCPSVFPMWIFIQ